MRATYRRPSPPLPPGAVDRGAGVRGALLHTLPGRAIVVGLGLKLLLAVVRAATGGGALPAFLAVVDTVAGLAAAVGLAYFAVRLIVLAKRRLLWRVRRKLILSYVFIGFVPALLLVAFSLLCGFLLFYSFSGYLVQSRLSALSERAGYIAQSTALEIQRASGRDVAAILARRQATEAEKYPDLSIAVVPTDHTCGSPTATNAESRSPNSEFRAGPWAHVDAPRTIPAWIDCPGFSG